jgi:hypothetical protein
MRPQRAVSGKKGREMTLLRRFLALASLAMALSGALLASPDRAAAHGLDTYHRHGALGGVQSACVSSLNGYGVIRFNVPDVMTTPGGTRRVYFRAFLQYYDYSRAAWVYDYWNGSRYVGLPYLNYQYADANDRGLVNGFWRDYFSNRYTPVNYSFDITAGYWYRVNIQYFWAADGTEHWEATNYCGL